MNSREYKSGGTSKVTRLTQQLKSNEMPTLAITKITVKLKATEIWAILYRESNLCFLTKQIIPMIHIKILCSEFQCAIIASLLKRQNRENAPWKQNQVFPLFYWALHSMFCEHKMILNMNCYSKYYNLQKRYLSGAALLTVNERLILQSQMFIWAFTHKWAFVSQRCWQFLWMTEECHFMKPQMSSLQAFFFLLLGFTIKPDIVWVFVLYWWLNKI